MASRGDRKARAAARVGTTMGRYRVDSLLASGGMADVYVATHCRNNKRVALKVLDPELSAHSSVRAKFQREGYAANSVDHPGAVVVHDDDVAEDGSPFIVMELLKGIGVEELRVRWGGRLPVSWSVDITEQLLEVLTAAHSNGIVHRDVKPPNLLLMGDGSLKVLDFGIARLHDAAALFGGTGATSTGDTFGTPGFMAPEQVLGRSDLIDAQTDVWAASATLFTLVTGELVHTARTPQELRVRSARDRVRSLASVLPNIPAAIADVVDRGLALEKSARWGTAAEMLAALHGAHVTTFGRPPDRVPEGEWLPPLPARDHDLPPTAVVLSVSSEPIDLVPRSMEDQPVSSSLVPKRRGAAWLTALLVSGLLAAAATVAMRLLPPARSPAPPPTAWAPVASVPVVPLPDGRSTSASGAETPVTVEPRPDPPRAAPNPRPAPPKPPAEGTNCNPPTTTDIAGIKHPKPGCI